MVFAMLIGYGDLGVKIAKEGEKPNFGILFLFWDRRAV
jgi:hypothetical protein